jgi:MerR family transcriptional regulator, light-induced transcriptional regulator
VSTISLQEAADRLGVHYMTAYRYVRTGRLRAERHAGRWRVAPDDLDALRAELTPPAGSRHQARLLDRLLAGDEAGAWLVVEQALVSRTTPDRAHLDLLAPCMAEVGRRWGAGTLSVGGEHVASATAMRVAARLAPLCARRGPHRGTVVLGGPPGEHHALPLTLLTNVLRARGWRVVELGPHTPVRDFVAAARGTDRLKAVGVSCASAGTAASAARVLAGVRAALPGTPLLAGGPGVAGEVAAESLGADGWGIDADTVDAWLDAGT